MLSPPILRIVEYFLFGVYCDDVKHHPVIGKQSFRLRRRKSEVSISPWDNPVRKDALKDIAAASMRSPVGSLAVMLITLTQHLLHVEGSHG